MRLFLCAIFLTIICCFTSPARAYNWADLMATVGPLLSDKLPKTCDPSFWDVMSNRAWEGAQREITQNGNLLAKPDSVLTYSCFDSHMGWLAHESDDNYPSQPNETFQNSFFGIGEQLFRAKRDAYNFPMFVLGDPYWKNRIWGWNLSTRYALEILILDTIVNNVSNLGTLATTNDIAAGVCGRKYYVEHSTYHHSAIGGRTLNMEYIFGNHLNPVPYNCDRMARIWDQAKCYDFNSEPGHDGFYTFGTYTATGGDYRTHIQACNASNNMTNLQLYGGMLCDIYFHGIPSLPINLYWPWSGTPPLTWPVANAGANPAPGAPGAVEPYKTFKALYDPTICATQVPIKTGVVVQPMSGAPYDDAYCMAPGCWYNPAVSTVACQPY